MIGLDLELALDTARRAVEAASASAMKHWRAGVRVETKVDRTPVTAADREAEEAILAVIRDRFPAHAILAEESGSHAGDARSRWIVDPLDGTRGFARGGFFWGPLVALEHEGEVVAGAAGMPARGEIWFAARGQGAWKNDGTRCRVSGIDAWRDATLSCGELGRMLALPQGPRVVELVTTCASTRSFGDPAAPAMLIEGRAEAWIEAGVKTWDLAPFRVLIEEAGGCFTCWNGTHSIETGAALGTNGKLHEHVLAALRDARRGA